MVFVIIKVTATLLFEIRGLLGMRFLSPRLVSIIVLGFIILASITSLSQESTWRELPPWYWFRVGAYAKYLLSVDVGPPTYTVKVGGEEYKVYSSKRYVIWNITGVEGEWFTVNQSLVFEDAIRLRDNARIPTLVAMSREFKINIKTLTTLVKLSDRRIYDPAIFVILDDYLWVFEWIFLLRPQSYVKIVISIIPWEGSAYLIPKDSQAYKDLMKFISQVNETVYMLSNGSRRYDIEALEKPKGVGVSDPSLVYVSICPAKPSPGYKDVVSASLDNMGVYLLTFSDPPAPRDYVFGNIRLGSERLSYLGSLPTGSAREHLIKYVRENKLLYGIAELNFTDPKLKPYNQTVLITTKGHVYCIGRFGVREAYYDVVSGILVYAKIPADRALELLWFRDPEADVTLGITPWSGIYAELKLIETNIDLSRPVIGEVKTTTPIVTPTQTQIVQEGVKTTAQAPEGVEVTTTPGLPLKQTTRGVEARGLSYLHYILLALGLVIAFLAATLLLYRRR